MIDTVKLGSFLRKKRKERDMTQKEVSDVLGIAERSLRNIERGITVTDLDTLAKMVDLYDILLLDLRDFYTRDADMAYIMGVCHIITEYDIMKQNICGEVQTVTEL